MIIIMQKTNYLKDILIIVFLFYGTVNSYTQVSISDQSNQEAHPSSVLELISDSKGFLLTRVNGNNMINDPAEALMIFNLQSNCIEIFVEGEWHEIWCEPIEPFTGPCEGFEEGVMYGGKNYQVMEIGDQCWFRENLNIGDRIDGTETQGDDCDNIEKFCYNDDSSNCDIYGGLYQWDQVMCGESTEGIQGICPENWRVPTHEDWTILEQNICEELENSNCSSQFPNNETATGWLGEDEGSAMSYNSGLWDAGALRNNENFGESDFNAIPGGYRREEDESFYNINTGLYWWTSTEDSVDDDFAWYRHIHYHLTTISRDRIPKESGMMVRCLLD